MINKLRVLIFLLLVGSLAVTAADTADPAFRKLEEAKKSFEKARAEFHTDVEKWFEKEENNARKAKTSVTEAVNRVKSDKCSYQKTGALPAHAPLSLRLKSTSAFETVTKIYKDVADEFTRKKKDNLALMVLKELEAIKSGTSQTSGELAPSEHWVALFNGKDFRGWNLPVGPKKKRWTVTNGVITTTAVKPTTILMTSNDKYMNFHLKVEAMMAEGGDCGITFRVRPLEDEIVRHYRVGIAGSNEKTCKVGDLFYSENSLNELKNLQRANPAPQIAPGAWFTQEVVAEGNQIMVYVNEKQVLKYTDTERKPEAGAIGIVARGDSIMRVRKVEIRELKATPMAPKK